MKKTFKFIMCSFVAFVICGCSSSPNPKPEPPVKPVYSYVFNNDSAIKLTHKPSTNDYSVSDLLFKVDDKIKFVDSATNPYKLVEGISISGERYGFSYVTDSFKASIEGTYSFTLEISDNGSKLTISKKEEPVINYYTVTFDANGHGSAPSPIKDVKEGSTINKPSDPSASGYIFEGWFKESTCINAWNFATETVNSNITLYAKWTLAPVPKYTVTFDTQGYGVAPENQIVEKGNKVTKPADPTEEGFQFMGWYKEKSCINVWNFNVDKVTSNITLCAKWEEVFERYFIVFDTGDVPYDLNKGVELDRKSNTSYKVSLSTNIIQPGLKIKFKDSKNNIYSGFNLETNAFESFLIKQVSDSIQFIAYGDYSFNLNPENLTSGISITCSSKKAHFLYEVNMNASYYYDLNYISSTEEKIIYKYSSFKFGKNYTYSVRTSKGKDSIFENIVFSSTTNTKRFVLNGTSFSYTADGEIGKNYKYDVTLTIYISNLSLEVDIRTA